jgi:hypothetical protein
MRTVPKNYRKPRFVENLKAVLTKDGLVSFECKVVGFPTPILRYNEGLFAQKTGELLSFSHFLQYRLLNVAPFLLIFVLFVVVGINEQSGK